MREKIFKIILISLGIIALWALFIFAIFYKDNTGLGKMFGVSIMFFLTRKCALGLGLLVLVLRIFGVIKNNSNLLYIFSTTVNLSLSIVAIGLFLFDGINMPLLHDYLLNLIVGFLLLAYMFFKSSFVDTTHSDH